MSEESSLREHQASFFRAVAAKDSAAASLAAKGAAAVLAAVTGDVFSEREQIQASLTSGLHPRFVAEMSVATPEMAAISVKGQLLARHDTSKPLSLERTADVERLVQGAATVTSPHMDHLTRALGACLTDEALATGDGRVETGRKFEQLSILKELLEPTTLIPFEDFASFDAAGRVRRVSNPLTAARPRPAHAYFSQLANFPLISETDFEKEATLVRGSVRALRGAACVLVEKALKADKGRHRQGIQAWFARFVALGAPLSSAKTRRDRLVANKDVVSPGFAMNVLAVLLRLAAPVCDSEQDKLLKLVDYDFVLRDDRLRFSKQPKLRSGSAIGGGDAAQQQDTRLGNNDDEAAQHDAASSNVLDDDYVVDADADNEPEDEDEDDAEAAALAEALSMSLEAKVAPLGFFAEDPAPFRFPTEIFFLTAAALEAYWVPLLDQWREEERFLLEAATRPDGGGSTSTTNPPAGSAEDHPLVELHRCAWRATVEDGDLLRGAVTFASATARWVRDEAARADAPNRFARIPAALVRTACEVWSLCARLAMTTNSRRARPSNDFFGPLDASFAALFCSEMMQRSDLISSPVVHSKLVDVVSTLLISRRPPPGGPRAAAVVKIGGRAGDDGGLDGAVMDSEQCRRALPVGLVTLYSALHAVEGLDVDAEGGFDKFNVRMKINALLAQLWNHGLTDARDAIVDVLVKERSDGGSSDRAGSSSSSSSSLSTTNNNNNNKHHPAALFGGAALDTVVYCLFDALERIEDGARIEAGRPDRRPPEDSGDRQSAYYASQRRTARGFGAIAESTLALLEELFVDARCARVLLLAPGLTPRFVALGLAVVNKLLRNPEALRLSDPAAWGFDEARLLGHAATVLSTLATVLPGGPGALVDAMAEDPDFDPTVFAADRLALLPGASRASLAALAGVIKAVRAKHAAASSSSSSSLSSSSSSSEASLKLADNGAESSAAFAAVRDRCAAALAALENSPGAAAAAAASSAEASAAAYEDALRDCQMQSIESLATDESFYFAAKASTRLLNPKRLAKELKVTKRDLMAPHPDGAIFVAFDDASMHCLRCALSGPAGTPYARGLFVFDVACPATYPEDPPLVQLLTTGRGTVRFNPNLYADGKVCLSLLGTWHAGDASEKWNPNESSLRQVLMSILTQILVAEPYFNEPGREQQRAEKEGAVASKKHNAGLRVATLRHAVLDHLRRPPKGLEEVARNHFRRVRRTLLADCLDDLDNAPTDLQAATAKVVREILDALDGDIDNHRRASSDETVKASPADSLGPPKKRPKADSPDVPPPAHPPP